MIQKNRTRITIATSQFPVSENIPENAGYIRRHIVRAAQQTQNGGL